MSGSADGLIVTLDSYYRKLVNIYDLGARHYQIRSPAVHFGHRLRTALLSQLTPGERA